MKLQFYLFLFLIALFFAGACKKETPQPPEPETSTAALSTGLASAITETSAVLGCTITSDNGSKISQAGICWDTIPGPDVKRSPKVLVNSTTNFTVVLSSLKRYKKYYARAFAANGNGTAYGQEVTFVTADRFTFQEIAGSTSPGVNCLKVNDEKIYAATGAGLFISADEGDTWMLAGFPNTTVFSLGVSDGVLFASLWDSSVHKSIDDGKTWVQVRAPFQSGSTNDFLIDGPTIYSTEYGIINKSTNNGASFTNCSPPNSEGIFIARIIRCGDAIYANYGAYPSLYKTKDDAVSWNLTTEVDPGAAPILADIDCCNNLLIFSCVKGLFFSADGGNTWSEFSGIPPFAGQVSVSGETIFWTNSSATIMKISGDAGKTWSTFNNRGIDPSYPLTDMIISKKAIFLFSQQSRTLMRCRR